MTDLLTRTEPVAPAVNTAGPLLRVQRQGEVVHRDVPLGAGKWTIGSSSQCQVHLRTPDVRPLQCLITLENQSAQVTRWAVGVRLNGKDFSQAALESGDKLTLGVWVLEYLRAGEPENAEPAGDSVEEPNACESTDVNQRLEALESAQTLLEEVELPSAQAVTPRAAAAVVVPSEGGVATFQDRLVLQLWTANHSARRRAKALINGIRAARFHADAMAADLSAMETELDLARAAYDCRLDSDQQSGGPAEMVDRAEEEEVARLQAEIAAVQVQLAEARQNIVELTAACDAATAETALLRAAASKAAGTETRLAELEAELAAREEQLIAARADLKRAEVLQRESQDGHHSEVEHAAELEAPLHALQSGAKSASEEPTPRAEAGASPAAEIFWGNVAAVAEADSEEANSYAGWTPFGAGAADRDDSEVAASEASLAATPLANFVNNSPLTSEPVGVELSVADAQEPAAPQSAPNEHAEQSQSSDPEPAAPAWAAAPEESTSSHSSTSFIDKYRHLLEEDSEPAPIASSGRAVIDDEFLSPSKVETCASGSEESDEALEAYMANMMRRVRSHSPAVTPLAEPVAEVLGMGGPKAAPARQEEPAARKPADFLSEEPISFEDLKQATRKVPLARDLSALREIANSSARGAIATHSQRRSRESAITKMIVAITATVSAAYLMASAPEVSNWQFWAGACTCIVGVTAAIQVIIMERSQRS